MKWAMRNFDVFVLVPLSSSLSHMVESNCVEKHVANLLNRNIWVKNENRDKKIHINFGTIEITMGSIQRICGMRNENGDNATKQPKQVTYTNDEW